MKTLVVLDGPPSLEGTAPDRCAVGLLRGLVDHGVDVRALAARQWFSPPGETPSDLPVEVVEVAPEPAGQARWQQWRRPRGELGRGRFGSLVRAAAGAADVLHLETVNTSRCNEGSATPAVLHLHYLARLDRSYGVPWRRQFREVLEFSLAEAVARGRYRYLIANSPVVADAIRRTAPGAEVVVAPLSLDPAHYPAAPLDGAPTAGIIGTAAWAPTAGAIRRLAFRVWPLVRSHLPDARLLVAGRGTKDLTAGWKVHGVEVVGEVASSVEFLRSLSVLAYPVERGSGMKVKVLESMASSLPVVTTRAGAEGIDGGDGVVVCREDLDLARAILELLGDAVARKQRGAAAGAAFLERYSPKPATEPVVELYRRMASAS